MVRSNEDANRQNEYQKAIKMGIGIGTVGVSAMAYKDAKSIANVYKKDRASRELEKRTASQSIDVNGGAVKSFSGFSTNKPTMASKAKDSTMTAVDNVVDKISGIYNDITSKRNDKKEVQFVSALGQMINNHQDSYMEYIGGSSYRGKDISKLRKTPTPKNTVSVAKGQQGLDYINNAKKLILNTNDSQLRKEVAKTFKTIKL